MNNEKLPAGRLLPIIISAVALTITIIAVAGKNNNVWGAAINNGLPTLVITTDDGESVTSRTDYKLASMQMQKNAKFTDADNYYNGKIQIRGRGNSTWTGSSDNGRAPLRIKLDKKANLLGMGNSKHWILLSNAYDNSFMKNKLAYDLGLELGLAGTKSEYVDVVLNDKYMGNYLLTESIRVENGRVDITDWEELAEKAADAIVKKDKLSDADLRKIEKKLKKNLGWITSGSVTYKGKDYKVYDYIDTKASEKNYNGGWIAECVGDDPVRFTTDCGREMTFKAPENLDTNEMMFKDVKNYINSMEKSLYAEDFCSEYKGDYVHYKHFIDMESFVKYNMAQMIMGQADNGSQFFYKDVDELIKFGPLWDFDTSSQGNNADGLLSNLWSIRANHDPYFLTKLLQYYRENTTYLNSLISKNGNMAKIESYIKKSADATLKDSSSFSKNVETLKKGMSEKIEFLNSASESVEKFVNAVGKVSTNKYLDIDISSQNEKSIVFDVTSGYSSVKKIAFYVNGDLAKTVDVEGAKASYKLKDMSLLDGDGSLNCLVVWGIADSGEKMEGLMNYISFEYNEPTSHTSKKRGDINGDGKINMIDTAIAIMYYKGHSELPVKDEVLDMDNDGQFSKKDISLMMDLLKKSI